MFDFGKRSRQLAVENDEMRIRLEREQSQIAMLEQQIADLRQQLQQRGEQQTTVFSVLQNELQDKRDMIRRMEESNEMLRQQLLDKNERQTADFSTLMGELQDKRDMLQQMEEYTAELEGKIAELQHTLQERKKWRVQFAEGMSTAQKVELAAYRQHCILQGKMLYMLRGLLAQKQYEETAELLKKQVQAVIDKSDVARCEQLQQQVEHMRLQVEQEQERASAAEKKVRSVQAKNRKERAQYDERFEELRAELGRYQQSLTEQQNEAAEQIEAFQTELQAKEATYEARIAEIGRCLRNRNDALSEANKRVASTQAALEKCQQENRATLQMYKEEQSRANTAEQQVSALQATLRAKAEEHTAQMAELNTQINSGKEKLRRSEEKCAALQARLDECLRQLEAAGSRMDAPASRSMEGELRRAMEEETDVEMFAWKPYTYKDPSGKQHLGVQIIGFNGFDEDKIVIPEQIDGKPVISIGKEALKNSGIKEVYFPKGLLEIGDSAFENSKIQKAYLSDSLIEIGSRTFLQCKELRKIDLSDSLIQIGSHAFFDCEALSTIQLPGSLREVGDCAFYASGIKQIRFPGSVKVIPESVCASCDELNSVILSQGIKEIKREAFDLWWSKGGNKVKYIIIPESVRTIRSKAFNRRTNSGTKMVLAFLEKAEATERVLYEYNFAEKDIPIYVRPGSAIQREARKNGYTNIHPLNEFPYPLSKG